MRTSRLAPLAAALLLAACGGGEAGEEPTAAVGGGDEAAAGAEAADVPGATVAVAAGRLAQPRPGEYRTTVELLGFDMPGMPEAAKRQMRAAVGSSMTQIRDFCLTPEEAAANGPEQMAKNLVQANCTMEKFNVTGNRIVADMACKGDAQGQGAGRMHMDGEMNAESSTMTMTMDQEMPGVGTMQMKMKAVSERTGECS
jgi:hypothetical protein